MNEVFYLLQRSGAVAIRAEHVPAFVDFCRCRGFFVAVGEPVRGGYVVYL